MAWIRTIDEDKAEGYLKTLYKKYGDPFEGVANILKIHSFNPESLRHHNEFYKHLMTEPSGLSRMQREMIALVVSVHNGCHYGVTHHGESLFLLTKNKSLVEAIKTDYHKADIGEKDIGMLAYAEKLTESPASIRKEDVDELKRVGFKEAQILDIALVAAFYAYVNRIASGLGVELESYWENKT